jgi:hypothetical protein
VGGACSSYGRNEKYTVFRLENLKGRYYSEDLEVDEKKILE